MKTAGSTSFASSSSALVGTAPFLVTRRPFFRLALPATRPAPPSALALLGFLVPGPGPRLAVLGPPLFTLTSASAPALTLASLVLPDKKSWLLT